MLRYLAVDRVIMNDDGPVHLYCVPFLPGPIVNHNYLWYEFAQRLHGATQALRTAMRAQWRGDMFNRAYLFNPGLQHEFGADLFWAEYAFAPLAEQRLLTATQVDGLRATTTSARAASPGRAGSRCCCRTAT
ncbi:MAG: hypothetical protein ABW252_03840, partial [Polyangiales bacterium]